MLALLDAMVPSLTALAETPASPVRVAAAGVRLHADGLRREPLDFARRRRPPELFVRTVVEIGDGDEAAATEDEAIEAVELLLELGADINAVDDNGETAMHGAAYQSLPKLVALLADRGADIQVWNRKNKCSWTPLMIAEGHRPGNFRPSPETIAAIERVFQIGVGWFV